jgi:hypothetical protein
MFNGMIVVNSDAVERLMKSTTSPARSVSKTVQHLECRAEYASVVDGPSSRSRKTVLDPVSDSCPLAYSCPQPNCSSRNIVNRNCS